jgi:flagellar motor switch/type III secretory pathway protein FliN
MPAFTAELIADIIAACQQNAASIEQALSDALEAPLVVESIEPGVGEGAPASGPGLAVILKCGRVGAALILPQTTGLLPLWYSAPDAAEQGKLETLAHDLATLVLPESLGTEGALAGRVEEISAALDRGRLSTSPGVVRLALRCGDRTGIAHLHWPLSQPEAILPTETAAEAPPRPAAAVRGSASHAASVGAATDMEDAFELLPPYSRSLLRIRVPVRVNLAAKKEPIRSIVELGAGAIIKFNKSCEETLELEVGGHRVARGEAVKVGDKFGLRITSMILPDAQFKKLEPVR